MTKKKKAAEKVLEALHEIGSALGPKAADILIEGLPGGQSPEWGYDDKLVLDLGVACKSWKERVA